MPFLERQITRIRHNFIVRRLPLTRDARAGEGERNHVVGVSARAVIRRNEDAPIAVFGQSRQRRPDDIVTAVGGTKTLSMEVFRKVLRRKLAEGCPLTFTVRRAEKTMEVSIPVKD